MLKYLLLKSYNMGSIPYMVVFTPSISSFLGNDSGSCSGGSSGCSLSGILNFRSGSLSCFLGLISLGLNLCSGLLNFGCDLL